MTREVQITARTLGVALISLQLDDDKTTGWLWVQIFFFPRLSPLKTAAHCVKTGPVFCEALGMMQAKEALLRLTFGDLTGEEIAGFRGQKKLVTHDLTLEVRPRA